MSPITHKIRALAAAGLVLGACAAAPAVAEAEVHRGTIEITVSGPGNVDGCTAASSPCTKSYIWRTDDPPEEYLSANPMPDYYAVSWSGCEIAGTNQCKAEPSEIGDGTPVSASFTPTPEIGGDLDKVYGGDASHRVVSPVVKANSSATAKVEFRVDGVLKDTQTSAVGNDYTGQVNVAGLTSGTHGLQATVTDKYGQVRTLDRTIRVDNTAPSASITGGPDQGAIVSAPIFTGSFTSAAPDGGDYQVTCGISKDPQRISSTGCGSKAGNRDFSTVFEQDPEGQYYWTVSAFDELGNISTARRSVVIDTTDPKLVVNGPAEGSTTQSATQVITPVVTDVNPDKVTCALDGGAAASCAGGITYQGLSNGVHKVVVKATDKAGRSVTLTRTWTVAVPPSGGGGGGGGQPQQQPQVQPQQTPAQQTTGAGPSQQRGSSTAGASPGRAAALTASIKAPKNAKRSKLGKGLKVTVTCSAACSGSVTLKAGGLKLTGTVKLTKAGTATVTLKPAKKAGSAGQASKAKVSASLAGNTGAVRPTASIALR